MASSDTDTTGIRVALKASRPLNASPEAFECLQRGVHTIESLSCHSKHAEKRVGTQVPMILLAENA
jgi:hypothetical protein